MELKTIRCSVCETNLEFRYYEDIQELVIDPCPCCMYDKIEENRETFHNEGFQEGYDEGEKYGYEEGQKEGYKTGKDDGYDEGYDDGKKIAWSDTIVDSTFLD